MDNHRQSYCSVAFSQVIFQAAVDVLGQPEAAKLLLQDNGCMAPDDLIDSLVQRYGVCGGRGIAQRMGRAAFKYFLDLYGDELNLTGIDFRLMPTGRRLQAGLEIVSRKLSEECGAQINLDADSSAYYWLILWQRETGDQVGQHDFAYFLAGMAQELMSWSGGGRFYNVRESSDGARCVLKIDQTPLD